MSNVIMPVTLSLKAVAEVHKIRQKKGIPSGYGLRVGVRGGGCGGHTPILGFDKKKETDLSYFVEDIFVLVDKKHVLYVVGKEIDFYEGSDASGFIFLDAQ